MGIDLNQKLIFQWIALIETIVIIFPLLCIPTIDSLKWTSTLAIICITIFVVISIYLGISNAMTGVFYSL